MKNLRSLPFYFGPPNRPLFGCYHEPVAGCRRQCAVLICQPMGHEYVNSHRALRQLAVRLADNGFPVLRFDYYGCGDSSGSSEEGRVPQWLEDISTAISEVRHRAGLTQVCLAGLRFGGALSVIVGATQGDIESLILWDPVVKGTHYLKELLSLQKEMLRFRPKPKRRASSEGHMDILGFPWPHTLYAETQEIDLLKITGRPARRILILQSDHAAGGDNLADHLSQTGVELDCQRLEAPPIWQPTADGSLLAPSQVLQAAVSWACRMHPREEESWKAS